MGGRDWEDVPPSEKILCSLKPYISQQYLCDKFINSKTYLMMFWGEEVRNDLRSSPLLQHISGMWIAVLDAFKLGDKNQSINPTIPTIYFNKHITSILL